MRQFVVILALYWIFIFSVTKSNFRFSLQFLNEIFDKNAKIKIDYKIIIKIIKKKKKQNKTKKMSNKSNF